MTADVTVPPKTAQNNLESSASKNDGDNIEAVENVPKDEAVSKKGDVENLKFDSMSVVDNINKFLDEVDDSAGDKIKGENNHKIDNTSSNKSHTENGLQMEDIITKERVLPENGHSVDDKITEASKPTDVVFKVEDVKEIKNTIDSNDIAVKTVENKNENTDLKMNDVGNEVNDEVINSKSNENAIDNIKDQVETRNKNDADDPVDEIVNTDNHEKKTDVQGNIDNDETEIAEIKTKDDDKEGKSDNTTDKMPKPNCDIDASPTLAENNVENHEKYGKLINETSEPKEDLEYDPLAEVAVSEKQLLERDSTDAKDTDVQDKLVSESINTHKDESVPTEESGEISCNKETAKTKENEDEKLIEKEKDENIDEINDNKIDGSTSTVKELEKDGISNKDKIIESSTVIDDASTNKDVINGNREDQIENVVQSEEPEKEEPIKATPQVLLWAPFRSCELSDSDVEDANASDKSHDDSGKVESEVESILGPELDDPLNDTYDSLLDSAPNESEGESILGPESDGVDDNLDETLGSNEDKERVKKPSKRKSRSPRSGEDNESDSDIQEIIDVPDGDEPKKKRRKIKSAGTGKENANEIRIGSSSEDNDPQVLPAGAKRVRKQINYNENELAKKRKTGPDEQSQANLPDKCFTCRQRTSEVKTIELPTSGVKEEAAIEDSSIRIDGDDNAALQFKLTNFTVFDRSGHIVPIFAPDIINKYKKLYFSGKVQSIIADDDDSDGVDIIEAGPIVEWTNRAGHDTIKEDIMLNTKVNGRDIEYHLVSPSDDYREVYESVYRMVYMSNKIITELCDRNERNELMEYAELLEFVANMPPPLLQGKPLQAIDEEAVQMYADFLVMQATSFEDAGDVGEDLSIMGMPCIKHLSDMAGVDRSRKEPEVHHQRERSTQPRVTAQPEVINVKAVTTPLVAQLFESKFREQMRTNDNKGKGQKVCTCRACQSPNCGRCDRCKSMISFGGETPDGQLTCYNRQCFNADTVTLGGDDSDDEDTGRRKKALATSKVAFSGKGEKVGSKVYYPSVNVETKSEVMQIKPGNYVLVKPHNNSNDLKGLKAACYIGKVIYLYKDQNKYKDLNLGHVQWMARGEDTVLGKTGDPKEYFLVAECETISLGDVLKVLFIEHRPITDVKRWREVGGTIEAISIQDVDGIASDGWYRLRYWPEYGRFDYPQDADDEVKLEEGERCKLCKVAKQKMELEKVVVEENRVRIHGEWYAVGDFLYLEDGTVPYKIKKKKKMVVYKDPNKDPKKYPEYYRKAEVYHGDHHFTFDPLQVMRVEKVSRELGKAKLKLRMLYRPDDTSFTVEEARTKDYSCLYWTNEFTVLREDVIKDKVVGKAWVTGQSGGDVEPLRLWSDQEQDRFYISEEFDSENKTWKDLDEETAAELAKSAESAPSIPDIAPLPSLDIFAGCGGLSVGLHNSGIADPKWAIEFWKPAADAFQQNFPKCKVLNKDCNKLLELQLKGRNTELPKKGEIEMMSGGPPCQGFSLLNMFKEQEYSKFKNSLVPTYLSYADFYRPKFFLLENVRNLVANEDGMVLKLCLSTMVRLGYQTSFGVFQAGHFGVAQTRRRLFIIAAAPGEKLPLFPTPEYCFYGPLFSEIDVDGRKFVSTNRRPGSARRGVTTWDAISDLPPIKTGSCQDEMTYSHTTKDGKFNDGKPRSHLQKMYRAGVKDNLSNHVCKKVSDLVNTRISYIPREPGSDWRDLPNMEVVYDENGQSTRKLKYLYKKPGENVKRGVCSCSLTTKDNYVLCDRDDKQPQTLMPWSLPHTADRKNHWQGVFGRVPWEGFFKTTITDPEPLGKQGMVLHPDQDRLVSVRECARSQGFPDHFRFAGTILDKHREIGNAVPPPMGRGIGLEIRKAIVAKAKQKEKL